MSRNQPQLDLFAEQLVNKSLLSAEQAQSVTHKARLNSEPLVIYLQKINLIEPLKLLSLAAQYFGMPLYEIGAHKAKCIPKQFMDLEGVEQGILLPLFIEQQHNRLLLAVAAPNLPQLPEIEFRTGLKIKLVLVEFNKLAKLLALISKPKGSDVTSSIADGNEMVEDEGLLAELEQIEVGSFDKAETKLELTADTTDDRPIVRFVNKILLKAIRSRASDIHFEPYEKAYRVRYRQDGILYEVSHPPSKFAIPILARLKIMANLDVSEHRVPQDGRFKITISKDQAVDFRISTCPTLNGEKVVIRILDSASTELGVANLGMTKLQQQSYLKIINQSQGMILVTGPTGSGKTVSLYSGLRLLNTTERNISTVEDPVEIYMQGINQVHVNPKIGMSFAAALRAFLRQDPDVIMVGEIRDLETAEIAIKAAQTGHLVLSTLHTNSAPLTLARLLNMGVQAFNIASSVILVMAQRLVRKLCKDCKQAIALDEKYFQTQGLTTEDFSGIQNIFKANPSGCDNCQKGYKGRIGIYEVMPISPDMQSLIMESGNALQIAELAHNEGVDDLRRSGINKVLSGDTSMEEINRVTI